MPSTSLSERQFQTNVIVLAGMLGWSHYHTHDSRRSVAGFPDLVLWRERLVMAELKTEKGKVSAAQQRVLTSLKAAGAETYIWRPSDWDRIQVTLSRSGPTGR